MSYTFSYSVTAKCHLMNNCIGLPGVIITGWGKIGANPAFIIDDAGMLMYTGSGQEIEGFYDPNATGKKDYSFTVPMITSSITSGAVGVLFRVRDKNNYYCFLWDDGRLGWVKNQRLIRVKNGLPQIVAEASGIIKNGYINIIEVQAIANRFIIKANGSTVFDFTDSENPILNGSYGIAVIGAAGARFPGVYESVAMPVDVKLDFAGSIENSALGLSNSKMINSTPVKDLMRQAVLNKMSQLNIDSSRYFVWGYTITAADVFVQAYFKLSEPVVYTSNGNCYIYAYLKSQPRVPEAPRNFRGTIVGNKIEWRWDDVSSIETGYVIKDSAGKRIGVATNGETVFTEPIPDDGITITRTIAAFNSIGESDPVEASVFVPIITPLPPSVFTGQALSTGSIKWSWSLSQYAEYYELLNENGTVIAIIEGNKNSFTESGLKPRKLYTRGLRAVRKGHGSEVIYASAETLGSSGLVSIEIPVNFEGEVLSPRVIRWTWDYYGRAAKFILYDIYGSEIAAVAGDSRSYIEYNLETGREYKRILIAVDSAGYKSAPVIASVRLTDEFEELQCDIENIEEPRYVNGFASGIGDGDDLKTEIIPCGSEITVTTYPLYEIEEETLVNKSAECSVQFIARGREQVEKDYGMYGLDCSLMPGAEVELEVKSEVYEPIPVEYHIEADVSYVKLQTVSFDYDIEIKYQESNPANRAAVDIVWIVDYSGSMDVYMGQVAQNARTFASSLSSSNIDYRLAVVHYDATAHKSIYSGQDWVTDAGAFSAMVYRTADGSGVENGINAILFALNNYQYRENAVKYFIILTDENADDLVSYNVNSLIDTLKNNNVTFSGIIKPVDCDPYPQLAQATGGTTIDIGTSNWGSTMSQLVNNIRQNVAVTATVSGLSATAHGGFNYQTADQRTIEEIVADYIASGGTGLPQDFFTAGYYTPISYKIIPRAPQGVSVRLTSGSNTSADGTAKIEAYSTVITQEQNITAVSGTFSLSELDKSATQQNPQSVYDTVPHGVMPLHFSGYRSGAYIERIEAENPAVTKGPNWSTSPDGKVLYCRSYIEYSFSTPANAVFVQLKSSDHNDGFAHVYIDDTDYGYFSTKERGDNYICIAGLNRVAHKIRVEAVGGDLHIDFIGTADVTHAAVSVVKQEIDGITDINGGFPIIKQVSVVSHNPEEFAVYTVDSGLSPVYAYPLRPLYFYNSWHFRDVIYADDGDKTIIDTRMLTPAGKDGQPYTGTNIKWTLNVIKADPGATVKWSTTDELTIGYNDVVIAKNDTVIERQVRGWAGAAHPATISVGVIFPDIPEAVGYRLRIALGGDDNVFAILSASGDKIYCNSFKTINTTNEMISISADIIKRDIERVWYGDRKRLSVCGQVELGIDVKLPPQAIVESYEFIIDNPAVNAVFKNSNDRTTTDSTDKLMLTYNEQEIKAVKVKERGTPVIQRVYIPYCQVYSAKLLGAKVDGKTATYACITDAAGATVVINRISDIPDSSFVEIDADIIFETPYVEKWSPASKSGFYYYSGEERYLYGESDVNESVVPKKQAIVHVAAILDSGGTEEERLIALSAMIPQDNKWHAITNEPCMDVFQRYGVVKKDEAENIIRFEVKEVIGTNIEARCDIGGTAPVEARATGPAVMDKNIAVLDGNMTAIVYPMPKSLAPITVLLSDGTPLRYVRFKNGDDYYSLDCTEHPHGNGQKFVYLAYNNIDPASIKIRFTPYGSSQQYVINRFKLCRNKLYLPVRIMEKDKLEVTYRLMDSFTAVPDPIGNTVTIKVHTDKTGPGDAIFVYYETSDSRMHIWEDANVNPLMPIPVEGFIKLGYLPEEKAKVKIKVTPGAITPNYDKEAMVTITATYADGSPAADEVIDIVTEKGIITLVTDGRGIASVYLETSSLGEKGITVSGAGTTVFVPVKLGQTLPEYICSIKLPSDKITAGESTVFSVYVTQCGAPAVNVAVRTNCIYGSIVSQEGVTDSYGYAYFTYNAPSTPDLKDVITAECKDVYSQQATASIYIGGLINFGPTVNNRIQDLPDWLTVDGCKTHTIDSIATTPPEYL